MKIASKAKKYSTKPFLITARDAVIVTALTLVATLLLTWIYLKTVGGSSVDWTAIAGQTIAISLAAQFAYEYSGVNNMIAESSIKYATGSTLSKYAGRRSALICDVHSAISAAATTDALRSFDPAEIETRRKVLKAAVENPSWVDADDRKLAKLPDDTRRIAEQVRAAGIPEYVLDHLSAGLCADILVRGFTPLTTVPHLVFFSRLSPETLDREARGEALLAEIGFE